MTDKITGKAVQDPPQSRLHALDAINVQRAYSQYCPTLVTGTCKNGTPFLSAMKCDGYLDCEFGLETEDKSDESNCEGFCPLRKVSKIFFHSTIENMIFWSNKSEFWNFSFNQKIDINSRLKVESSKYGDVNPYLGDYLYEGQHNGAEYWKQENLENIDRFLYRKVGWEMYWQFGNILGNFRKKTIKLLL